MTCRYESLAETVAAVPSRLSSLHPVWGDDQIDPMRTNARAASTGDAAPPVSDTREAEKASCCVALHKAPSIPLVRATVARSSSPHAASGSKTSSSAGAARSVKGMDVGRGMRLPGSQQRDCDDSAMYPPAKSSRTTRCSDVRSTKGHRDTDPSESATGTYPCRVSQVRVDSGTYPHLRPRFSASRRQRTVM